MAKIITLAYDDIIQIPELRAFTRQRVFTLAGYCAKNGMDLEAARKKEANRGEPEIQLSAECMVIDGCAKPAVPQVHIGDVVEIEGKQFTVARPKWGDSARLIPVV